MNERKITKLAPAVRQLDESNFAEVVRLIESARQKAYQAVNTTLVELYWQIGKYISQKLETAEWGEGVVTSLADYLCRTFPGQQGFTRRSLFRMRQFYDTYHLNAIVSPLVTLLPWTHNLMILSRCKLSEEREFYIRLCLKERWTKRELERQLAGALFERTVLTPPQISPTLREQYPSAVEIFKDAYLLEFLGLPKDHSENDLHHGLLIHLGRFITELGHDFCFIGSEYTLQVGGKDFLLDLLFYHRGLNCLIAVELKIDEFQPEYLGKLEFYLEALDRDIRKPHEQPSIGILLCAGKDSEVVEYALSRSLSPALIAEYQIQLPDKKLLQAKLHEFYNLNLISREDTGEDSGGVVEEIIGGYRA